MSFDLVNSVLSRLGRDRIAAEELLVHATLVPFFGRNDHVLYAVHFHKRRSAGSALVDLFYVRLTLPVVDTVRSKMSRIAHQRLPAAQDDGGVECRGVQEDRVCRGPGSDLRRDLDGVLVENFVI